MNNQLGSQQTGVIEATHPPTAGEFFDGKCWFERKAKLVTLGVTNLALEELGAVESIEFAEQGLTVDQGDIICTIHGSEASFEVESPAAGTVEAVNDAAAADESLVSDDPLDEGWLVTLAVEDPADLIAASGISEAGIDSDDDEDEDEEDEEDEEDDLDLDDDDLDDLDGDDLDEELEDDDGDENEF